jgi:hypothetical protein
MSIMPIGLAINAASSATETADQKHEEMDIDAYNEKLTQRIDEIKKTCGM